MRKHAFLNIAMLGFLLALAAASVAAQSSARIAATIPFDFTVGGTQLRAGKYTIKALTSESRVLAIQNRDGKSSVIRMAGEVYGVRPSAQTKLVFHRYGELYFLSEVWTAGEASGCRLTASRQEQAIRREWAKPSKKQLAGAQSGYESVVIVGILQ